MPPIEDTINDLKMRVEKLEQNQKAEEENFYTKLSSLKVAKEKETEEKKAEDLQNVLTLFADGMHNNGIDPEYSNLPIIVEYAVMFVEKFSVLVMKIMGLNFTEKKERSHFKFNLCVDLISELFEFKDEERPFLFNLINTFVKLLCNSSKYEEVKEIETLKRNNKKYGSMKKMGKFLAPFNKK